MLAVAPFLSLAIIFSFIATYYVRKILLKNAAMDVPNERSLHSVPVPRGGGIAVIGVVLAGLIITALIDQTLFPYLELIGATMLLVAVSWLDDKKGLHPALRLCIHLMAAYIGTLALPSETVLLGGWVPFWLDRALMILGWGWFMNLYNFMDGIDGITATESICILMGAAFLMTITGTGGLATYALIVLISGSCLGFLLHNWHPASIFLGDVGSVPLGFLIGFVLLSLVADGYPIPALILPLYYLADSTFTLLKRALRKEKVWQAHREHFYQKAALTMGRHDKVIIWIGIGNIALVVASILAIDYPCIGALAAIVITAYLLAFLNYKSKMVP